VGLGAQVALGHQRRPKGIMDQVVRFARAYQWEVSSRDVPILYSFLSWPDRAALSEDDRTELRGLVRIDEPDEPAIVPGLSQRAAALAAMRQRMNRACHARICLSGKARQKDPGLVSGVLEEASGMVRERRPVYLSGMMGGAAALLIDQIRGRDVDVSDFGGEPNRTRNLLEPFRGGRPARFAELGGLTEPEQDGLYDAQNLDTIVDLTARGLLQLKAAGRTARVE
jgi:hypothetical protein